MVCVQFSFILLYYYLFCDFRDIKPTAKLVGTYRRAAAADGAGSAAALGLTSIIYLANSSVVSLSDY